jgi:hypothetical protein
MIINAIRIPLLGADWHSERDSAKLLIEAQGGRVVTENGSNEEGELRLGCEFASAAERDKIKALLHNLERRVVREI